VGYAYSILGDFHLAEDAAQEAFLEAYRDLPKLRNPDAFPSWFRKIVFKHCDRLTRRKRVETIPFEAAIEMPSDDKNPLKTLEEGEMKDKVLTAIDALPEKERIVTTLFYINGYSREDIGSFLDVAVKTVSNQLYSARRRLRERMIPMVKEKLHQTAPSQNNQFKKKVTGVIGKSQAMAKLRSDIQQLQKTEENVLIIGESGTGKWMIGRLIHFGGPRGEGPLIELFCATIAADSAFSLFFGEEKDGATLKQGYIEAADGGTLLLDEIEVLSLDMQAKLAGVLRDGCVTPVGGGGSKRVDVRVITLVNANTKLKKMVEEGTFHDVLYARIAAKTVFAPSLRDHKEDIPLLVEYFARQMGVKNPSLSDDALSALMSYAFPQNVRDLVKIIERALRESDGATIQPEHLHLP